MIVKGSEGISHVARHVREQLLPGAPDAHVAANLRFTAMCLDLVAEDFDRVVDVIVTDRAEIAAIFEAAQGHLAGELQARVGGRLGRQATSLRVAALTQLLDDDIVVLIELHALCENSDASISPWAAEIDAAIWRFLTNYAERRKYQSPI